MNSTLPVIVMAGQDIQEETTLKEQIRDYVRKDGERYLYDINKALIRIYGKPVIEHVLESAAESSVVGDIVIVGPAQVGDWLEKSEYKNRARFREQGPERVENALRGKEALGKEELTMLLAGDIPLINYKHKSIEEMINKVLQEGYAAIAPVISKTYARNEWGELFRPENSWASIRNPHWQDETHETDKAGNVIVKEGNYLFVDFSDKNLNLEPLRGSLGLVKQRSIKNKLKGIYELARIVSENAKTRGYSQSSAVPYTLIKFIKAQIATATRSTKALTEEELKRMGTYITGLPPETIIFPETRVFEQHPDLDSLEDAYKIAREIYRREHGGKDISDYRELEDRITYRTEEGEMPLIKALKYDKLHMADFTRKKDDWLLMGDEAFSEVSAEMLRKNPAFNMENLFYAKMNHALKEQRL